MRIKKMPITVLEHIKGSEIPAPWRKKAKASPDQTFTITMKTETTPAKKKERLQEGREDTEIEFGVFDLGAIGKISRKEIYDYL